MFRSGTRPRLVAESAVVFGALALAVASFSHAASASLGDVAATVDPGVVDIYTELGYQNASAAGTGIVLTSSGEILTNNHVIRGATKFRVRDVGNGRSYSATVVGYNVSNDIAVLQLKGASGLQTAAIGDPTRLKAGDLVTAFGNAGGAGGTPSEAAGKVLGLGRSITASDGQGDSERLTGLIETNAALQPGDSGGPLVDSAGRVVGIDTAAASGFQFQLQAATTDGYAIPIDHALSIAKVIESGHGTATTHVGPTAFLGVSVQPNGPADGYFADQAESPGALVAQVLQGSPAARAGLGYGDVITAIDGRTIATPTTLTSLLLTRSPSSPVRITWVDQYGTAHHASVKLASGPPQ